MYIRLFICHWLIAPRLVLCVSGYRNKQTDEKLSFLPIPRDADRQAAWLKVIGRNDLIDRVEMRDRVCSKHFGKKAISELVAQKLMPNAVPTEYLPTSLYVSPMRLEHDKGISDVATQTDITYGGDKDDSDVFVEVFGRTVLIKKEKDPERPKISTFMLDRPIKREPGISSILGSPRIRRRSCKNFALR